MDATDRRIVALLREDARRSFQDIGKQVHLSAPAVKRRVDRLERDGVMLGYSAVVDPQAYGWHAEAFVELYCEGTSPAGAIKRAVEREPGVVSAHTVAGEASALLHVMARGHQGPRARAGADPRHRRGDPDRHRGRPLDPVSAMRRPVPRGPAAVDPRLHGVRGAHPQRPRATAGTRCPPAWYEIPVFYFTNPGAVYGDGDEIPMPADTAMLDYELELACVIGEDGRPEGFTIMNDFSARDLQGLEMQVGLGPAKGKDFATALGPVLVSPDELPADLDMRAIARVNGEVRTDSRTGGMHYCWDRLMRPRPATPRGWSPARSSAPAPSGAAASSSTATAAGCSRATRWSWRSRGSGSCATGSCDGAARGRDALRCRSRPGGPRCRRARRRPSRGRARSCRPRP